MIPPIRLLRLPDVATSSNIRAVMVSIKPAMQAGQWLIQEARGVSLAQLNDGACWGPYYVGELADKLEQVITMLVEQGFVQSSAMELLLALQHGSPSVRARAAIRLGWRKEKKAVPFLLLAAQQGTSDICSILDALGHIGDPSAIPLAREWSTRKNLSRRRSAIEALRNLGDQQGLTSALTTTAERLPVSIRSLLPVLDTSDITPKVVKTIEDAICAEIPEKKGMIADLLYERNSKLSTFLAQRFITPQQIRQPHSWRYAKSMFKRAMLREDMTLFAMLAYTIEQASVHYTGQQAIVKSGYNGKKHTQLIFGKKTQQYIRRYAWRYMRDLARYRPEKYIKAASLILSLYKNTDIPTLGDHAYLLNQILYNNSQRLTIDYCTLTHRAKSTKCIAPDPNIHEEAFSELWAQYPLYYIYILGQAPLARIQNFALRGLLKHPEILEKASIEDLWAIISIGYLASVEQAVGELERRFADKLQQNKLHWPLMRIALQQTSPIESIRNILQDLCLHWLEDTQQYWSLSTEQVFFCLEAALPKVRMQAARLSIEGINKHSAEQRDAFSAILTEKLQKPEPEEGFYAPLIFLAKTCLVTELGQRFTIDELVALIRQGSSAEKEIAALLLPKKTQVLSFLGLEGVISLANHEIAAVRSAAYTILQNHPENLQQDLSPLFTLSDSDWPETRVLALQFLRNTPLEKLGLEGIIGLCDSARDEVQAVGLQLMEIHFAQLPTETLLFRLAEHPAQRVQQQVLMLIRHYLGNGLTPIKKIDHFIRASLLDCRPTRKLKYGLLDYLFQRSQNDRQQAEYIANLLSDVLRTHTQGDFQRIAEGLVQIQSRFPDIRTDLQIIEEPSLDYTV